MRFSSIIFIFSFLAISVGYSQRKVSSIANDLKQYGDTHFEETIFLHTNSTFLLSGETLLFKVYCLNATQHVPSRLSTIAYVELIDVNATSVLQAKVLLTNGTGSGDLFLPSSLSSGNYTLIAYTNWMKNYPVEKFFSTQLVVINPFKKAAQAASKKTGLQAEFFPEGGKLLSGVKNTVVFNVENEKLQRKAFTGKVIDNNGSTILEFSPSAAGTGRFEFTPETGKEYKAIVSDSLHNVSFHALPKVIDEGIAMQVTETANSFSVNLTSRSVGKSAKVKMIVHHKSMLVFEKDVQFDNERSTTVVDKSLLPAGISQISIVSEGNSVIGERLIFKMPTDLSNADLQIEKRNYKTREKVNINLTLKDAVPGNISMSVRKLEPHVKDPYSISNYLLLENGNVEMSSLLKTTTSLDDHAQLQKKSYYPIDKLTDEPTSLFLPEVRGNLITGTVQKANGEAAIKEKVYLSVPAANYLFFASVTDSTGRFYFNTEKINFNTDIVLQVDPGTCTDCKIKLSPNRLTDYSMFAPLPLEIDSTFKKTIERRSILAQIENAYYTEKQDSIVDKAGKLPFFGQPDKSYRLDDFVRFPTMQDIFIEYIAEIMLRKKGDKFEIRAMDFKERFAFNDKPLILLDGIPLFDHAQVMDYNPLLLERIDVLGRRYFYGPLEAHGIISLVTYTRDGKNVSLPYREKYIGILPQKHYYSPDYSHPTALAKIPDYRTQLYWNPDITLSSKRLSVGFYTSDVKGDFEILVEGVQADGRPIHYRDVIHVD